MKKVLSFLVIVIGISIISTTGSGCRNNNNVNNLASDSIEEVDSVVIVEQEMPQKDSAMLKLARVMDKYDNYYNFGQIIVVENIDDFKQGVINRNGEVIVPREYNSITYPKEGLFTAKKGGQYSLYDIEGNKIVSEDDFDYIIDTSNGLTMVCKEDKIGYVNSAGKLVIPCIFEKGRDFSSGIAPVFKDGSWCCIDKTGKELFPIENNYEDVDNYINGLAKVTKLEDGEKIYGIIDDRGKEIIPCGKYKYLSIFSDGLIKVENTSGKGFVDKSGKEIIPAIYSALGEFSEGLAYAKTDFNGNFGFINRKNIFVIPCNYTSVTSFSNGVARVKQDGKWMLIDKTGKSITKCEYEEMGEVSDSMISVKNGKWGYINTKGEEIIPFVYDEAEDFKEGLARVIKKSRNYKDGSKYGFVNKKGESTFDYESEMSSTQTNNDGNIDWLQGHWMYRQGSYEAHLVIKENTVRQYSSLNPESTYYTFRVDGNTMYIKPIKNDGTDFFVTLDYQKHRIDYGDGNWMRKVE